MNTKSILLTYATRFGSTQEVAETIAASLRQAGFVIDMQRLCGREQTAPARPESSIVEFRVMNNHIALAKTNPTLLILKRRRNKNQQISIRWEGTHA